MNHLLSSASALLLASSAMLALGASCSDSNDDDPSDLTAKEQALKAAVEPYVTKTVIPTYTGMADAAIKLYDKCLDIRTKSLAGNLASTDVSEAGSYWKASRRYWELSEAWLYGPAADHNIDPHIDSWPLDKTAMDALLADIRAGKKWSIENHGGYGLLGFHSVEYMLFELSADGNSALTHSLNYSKEELEYLVAVALDLRNQCVLLEQCWAGTDGISSAKQSILADADLGYNDRYGEMMLTAGQAGSRFKTYQEAAEELVQGCIDIVDEVGNTKIGRPHIGSSEEDRNYIESPYSLNSIEDFQDNIRSVQNAYQGSDSGDASVSDYVKSQDATLDANIRSAIASAITTIGLIPEPFAKNAKGTAAANAITALDELQTLLQQAMTLISKQ